MIIMSSILLLLGLFQVTVPMNRLRTFIYTNQSEFNKANCPTEHGRFSLVTIYDLDDAEFVWRYARDKHVNTWLGLHKKKHSDLTWSDGTPVTFNESNYVESDELLCEALNNGTWKVFNCSDEKKFMCQKDGKFLIEDEEKDWCRALGHCRNKYGADLASIHNSSQNAEAKNQSAGESVWIGLMHDQWEWAEKCCSTFRRWNKTGQGDCAVITKNVSPLFSQFDCFNNAYSLCSDGHVRIKVVKRRLNWEAALTYCERRHSRLLSIEDKQDQCAVETWLNHSGLVTTDFSTLWIGLRQSSLFGFWIWRDALVSWNNWKDGQIPDLSTSRHCGVIVVRENHTWSNENCYRELPFICEEDIITL